MAQQLKLKLLYSLQQKQTQGNKQTLVPQKRDQLLLMQHQTQELCQLQQQVQQLTRQQQPPILQQPQPEDLQEPHQRRQQVQVQPRQQQKQSNKNKQRDLEDKVNQLQDTVRELEEENLKQVRKAATVKVNEASKQQQKKAGNTEKFKGNTNTMTITNAAVGGAMKKGNKKNKKQEQLAIEEIPDYSDDETSVNDGIDYRKAENYAVKKIIGHKREMEKGAASTLKLFTRWKGWRDTKSITLEPLEHMIQDWPNEVRDYCKKNPEMKKICKNSYAFLFKDAA